MFRCIIFFFLTALAMAAATSDTPKGEAGLVNAGGKIDAEDMIDTESMIDAEGMTEFSERSHSCSRPYYCVYCKIIKFHGKIIRKCKRGCFRFDICKIFPFKLYKFCRCKIIFKKCC